MTWKLAVELVLLLAVAPIILTVLGSILVTIVTTLCLMVQFGIDRMRGKE